MNEELKLKITQILKFTLRILLGAYFITSAVLKLLSLDTFELYIYSFKIFSFNFSTIIARLVITCEILAGSLLIAKIRYREAWWLTMLMLIGFTLLLCYTAIFRDDQNCHCMGELVQIKPSLSIVKNIVTIALLLLIRKEQDYNFKIKNIVLGIIIAISIIIPFAIFPTDSIYNLVKKNPKSVHEATFNGFLQDSAMRDINIDHGNYIIGVLSSGCEFCRISGIKIREIAENNNIDNNNILFFIWGDKQSIDNFKKETKTEGFKYVYIDPVTAVRMVNGSFPTYIFTTDGDVVKTVNLRQLTEKDVKNHLK